MAVPAYSSVAQWYTAGERAHNIRTINLRVTSAAVAKWPLPSGLIG